MRRHLLAVFVACVSIAGAAERALSDGDPYDYAAPITPTAPSWTGFYLGAHLGGAWGSSTATDSSGATLNDYWSSAPSGVVAGATLGYNWQLGPMLYGIEGDLGYLGLAGSATTAFVPLGYEASTSTDHDFYMTLRGRLGVLMNGWMLYVTGGYLGSDTTVSVLESCDDITCDASIASASSSSFRNGWTIGGGFEAAIEQGWTAKVEYLYYDLGSISVTTPASTLGGPNTWTVDTDGQLVRAGMNYRFNSFKFGQ
ncbi:MAG: outer membrane beta-barrel protein [Hyphomicrobium sp.]|uniref:outer membrane protein n=1 Tax=Hyphomicrobium sp. TaxID=82 RepID=UPI001322ED57|nr:outer membrane beta-barrel protein [Hyphomicrobium sp.]KAB2940283.1 MAG: porin family protein [Hyphomicrobium sp.]MBZ0211098.1 outer membrane beta-barrel protein [Hyphomicrobium sp.]